MAAVGGSYAARSSPPTRSASRFAFALASFAVLGATSTRRPHITPRRGVLFVGRAAHVVLLGEAARPLDATRKRADHSTVDDLVGVFGLVTTGAWLFFAGASVTGLAEPQPPSSSLLGARRFSSSRIGAGRSPGRSPAAARRTCRTCHRRRRRVGQLVARKLVQHPEYGIRVLGFVDAEPREPAEPIATVIPVLGRPVSISRRLRRHRASTVSSSRSPRAPRTRRSTSSGSLRDRECRSTSCRGCSSAVGPACKLHTSRACRSSAFRRPSFPARRARQAGDRHRRSLGRPAPDRAALPLHASSGQARLARPGLLPARAARPGHARRSRPEVPHDARRHRCDEEHRAYISR